MAESFPIAAKTTRWEWPDEELLGVPSEAEDSKKWCLLWGSFTMFMTANKIEQTFSCSTVFSLRITRERVMFELPCQVIYMLKLPFV